MQTLKTARLIDFLRDHDNPAYVGENGQLCVHTPYADGRRWETIPATWKDVRAHLGY